VHEHSAASNRDTLQDTSPHVGKKHGPHGVRNRLLEEPTAGAPGSLDEDALVYPEL
jgi:hypothetical protein